MAISSKRIDEFGSNPVTPDGDDFVLLQDSTSLQYKYTTVNDLTAGAGVSSVNSQTGVVVLDTDDISDSGATNKYVTSAEKTKLSNLSGTNTGDQDLTLYAQKANNLSDLTNTTTARTNLGLGTAATHSDSDYVHSTGAETVAGVKSFSSFPVTPSSAPTTDYQTANKKYVDDGLATKQATGNYITALTGDVTASGPGSASATLANSGVSAGSYTTANITVDAKGRVTSASNGSAGSTSPLTTKGDLYTYSTTNARLPVGSDGQMLYADSTQTTGIKWAAAPSGGGTTNNYYTTLNGTEFTVSQTDTDETFTLPNANTVDRVFYAGRLINNSEWSQTTTSLTVTLSGRNLTSGEVVTVLQRVTTASATAYDYVDLRSPDGNVWRVSVNNAGNLITTDI